MIASTSRFAVKRFTAAHCRSVSFWSHVEMGPADPILGISEAYQRDTSPNKINVGVGAYRNDEGKPWVLPSVRRVEQILVDEQLPMEYAGIAGVPEFVKGATELVYGAESDAVQNNSIAALQSLSGTGALRLSASFISKFSAGGRKPTVYFPNPTWGNHFPIYGEVGLPTSTYRYWDSANLDVDSKGMLQDLGDAEDGSVVLLHACAHNPTGMDPTMEQWAAVSKLCKDKNHFVLFDNAYQGFASGDTDKDAAAIRLFIDDGHKVAVSQSFAKNFGLYGHRIGNFSIMCDDADEAARVNSQLKIIARSAYSNPPVYGARLVSKILNSPDLKAQWQDEIRMMADRIISMRTLLKDHLQKAGSTKNWDHVTKQIGMFSYTGMTPEQCDDMMNNHSVYLTRNGRISMAGVTSGNVEYLANAIHEVTK